MPTTYYVAIVGEAQQGPQSDVSRFAFTVYAGPDEAKARSLKATLEGLGLAVSLAYTE